MSESKIRSKFSFLTDEQYDEFLDEVLEAAENSEESNDAVNAAFRYLMMEGIDESFIRNNTFLIEELVEFYS